MNASFRATKATLPPLDEVQRQRAVNHLGLAHRLAWKQYQTCAQRVPLDELRGEALYALTYAAGMFEERRGVPFGAYAAMAIRHRLIQAANSWRRGSPPLGRCSDPASASADFDVPCPRTREAGDGVHLREVVERMRRLLPPRWFQALQLHYAHGCSLEEVGQRLGVSRERVRQLLNKAVGRVRQEFVD